MMRMWPLFFFSNAQGGIKCSSSLLPSSPMHTTNTSMTRVIITPADDDEVRVNTSDVENLLVGELLCKEEDVVKSQYKNIPNSVEEITRDWVLFVMKQHQMRTFGRRLSSGSRFTEEPSDKEAISTVNCPTLDNRRPKVLI